MVPSMVAAAASAAAPPLLLLPPDLAPRLVAWAGRLAPLSTVVLFVAPVPTLRKVSRDKSVGSLPLLPYSSMLANAFVWTCYGLMQGEYKIWACNGLGVVLAAYYCARFVRFAPAAAPTLPGSVAQHAGVVLAVVAATLLVACSPWAGKRELVGIAGVGIAMALFASPLAALRRVVATKSAAALPLPLSVAMALNGLLWATFGAWGLRDINVTLPSAMGLASGLAQVALKLVYGDGKEKVHPLPI